MERKSVLFICQGNVGRSQMAEAYYNSLVKPSQAISGGVDDVAAKYQGRPSKEIVKAMLEDGIDISHQVVKQVKPQMVLDANRVVVLCSKDICPPFVLGNTNTSFREVMDPYKASFSDVLLIRNQIKNIVLNLKNE